MIRISSPWFCLATLTFLHPAALQSQTTPSKGDVVTVQLDGTPLLNGNQIALTARGGTKLTVQQEQGEWLLVSNSRIRNAWVHRNHVALDDAPTTFGEEPVPLANLMRNPLLDPGNPFLLMHLPQVASGLLASGRGMELIRLEDSMMETLNRIQDNPIGVMSKVDVVGILSDAYRMAGQRETAISYLNRHHQLLQQARRNVRGVDLSLLERIGISGWAQSRYGHLVEGERKLADATSGLDTLLKEEDLKRKFLAMDEAIDGQTHTRHAQVLIKLGRVEQARTQLQRAVVLNQAFREFQDFYGRNASGTQGLTETLLSVCEADSSSLRAAYEQMDAGQRKQHRYATWSGHISNPYQEFEVRETPDEYMDEALHYAISLAVRFPKAEGVPVSEISAQWLLNHKLRLERTLQKRMALLRHTSPHPGPAGYSPALTGSPFFSLFDDIGSFANSHNIVSTRGLAADYRLRRFAKVDLPVVRQEFETLRHVGIALVQSRIPNVSPPSGVGYILVDGEYKVVSADPNKRHDEEAKRTWVDIEKLRKRLDNGQVLIEFVRYRDFDFESLKKQTYRWGPDRYAAWIIPANGEVIHRDLGSSEPIDHAISRFRQAIQTAGGAEGAIRTHGERDAVHQLFQDSRQVSKLLLEPLRNYLEGKRGLILCPDSELWTVPWAALPWTEDKFLVEEFQLRQVMTGRDLISDDSRKPDDEGEDEGRVAPTKPLILADPDFDLPPERVVEMERELLEREAGASLISVARRGKSLLPQVERLPFTGSEAEGIAPAIQRYCGAAPDVFVGEQALEGIVAARERPRILVLATHGFVLPTNQDELGTTTLPIRDATMRCGLLLAGSNRIDEWLIRRGADGVLTGYEVAVLDLRGTELVVLSACQTGLGDVKYGEGVAGLRQAFQLAGAESVLASLWQIPDRDTALIMIRFFEFLAMGQSKPEALRNAQLKRLRERRDRNGAAHPFFWAAFTITGE